VRFWVDYHLLIGFTHIYLYDRWGDDLLETLRAYIARGTVTLVPFPFFSEVQVRQKYLKAQVTGWAPNTAKTYDHAVAAEHCLMLARQNGDPWVLFEDLDEFIKYPDQAPGRLNHYIDQVLLSANASLADPKNVVEIQLDRYNFGFAPPVPPSNHTQKESNDIPQESIPPPETVEENAVRGTPVSPSALSVIERFVHRSSERFGGWGGKGSPGKVCKNRLMIIIGQ
jgi:hypothetical protein